MLTVGDRLPAFELTACVSLEKDKMTAGSVGRNPKEALRVLDALQTDELCPCNWTKGEDTLDTVKLLAGE